MSDTRIRPTNFGRLKAFRRPQQALLIRCDEMEKDLVLTLMFRDYCSLCHKMRDALQLYQQQYGFALEVVDVDADAALEEKYNELVPVLLWGDREICHWFLDEALLRAFLAQNLETS